MEATAIDWIDCRRREQKAKDWGSTSKSALKKRFPQKWVKSTETGSRTRENTSAQKPDTENVSEWSTCSAPKLQTVNQQFQENN